MGMRRKALSILTPLFHCDPLPRSSVLHLVSTCLRILANARV
jgi:hypothetical protein